MKDVQTSKNTQCLHEHIQITETGLWETTHYRDAREPEGWWHNNEPSSYNKMIDVYCKDCGLSARYSKEKSPKWLKAYIDELKI